MNFEEFAKTAHRMWEDVPASYKRGVDGIVVKPEVEAHPQHDDYYTMGTCFTEPYPSGYDGPDSTRSILALYYGSFSKLAESDTDFRWEEELWETITHELRHHLEFLVEDDALGQVDYAMEQTHRRTEGLDFDPWYYQSGEEAGSGVYRVEGDVYIEQRWLVEEFLRESWLQFEWDGCRWMIPRPADLGDIHYIWVTGPASRLDQLQIVLVRDLSMWERIRRLSKRAPLELLESEGEAEQARGTWR